MKQGMTASRFAASALACLLACASAPATAQEDDQFFQGKTMTLIVGISAGGGYDQYGRLLSRHFPRHIAGEPTIVVRNMPGAGSLTSVLHLKNIAPADGTQFATFNAGLLNDSMSDGERAKVKFDEFAWLGSMAKDLRVCFSRKGSGIDTLRDLQARKGVIFGASGVNSNSANGVSMLRNLFNLDLRTISAYPGNTEMNLAIERGEVDGTCISWTSIPEHWIKEKRINVLLRLSPNSAPEIPAGAAFIGDMVATNEQKAIVDILVSSGDLARPFILPLKTPPKRLALLRAAFTATMADRAFLADAAKIGLAIEPVDGETAERIVARLYGFPPALIEKARNVIKE
jgi:tripartite-type tricarboxylate transporter receptor subunit TctC